MGVCDERKERKLEMKDGRRGKEGEGAREGEERVGTKMSLTFRKRVGFKRQKLTWPQVSETHMTRFL